MNNFSKYFYLVVGLILSIVGIYLTLIFSLWWSILLVIGIIELTYPLWYNRFD